MNQSTAFKRKIVYLVILVATLVPLYLLGQPSDGTPGSGGQLATMRMDYGIAESDLGEISPASETMKLASLGLRGVAATLLWEKAHEYRVLHEWDRLKASLNNIALLQPHYERVWEHQAWNLAYNVSAEFDDYRQRYEMVREGTEYLTRGVRQNRKAPRLIWYTGWFYGQKIGMSDEKRQFRRLFSDDEILHEQLLTQGVAVDSSDALGPFQKPDNWLVGRLWLEKGYEIVDKDPSVRIRRQTPINFYETGPKWSIKHAEAIEKEGVLDERAVVAWTKASENWERFGKRNIPTRLKFNIKLSGLDDLLEERDELTKKFRELAGSVYTDMRDEKVAALPIDVRKVYEKKPEERTAAGKEAMPNILAAIEPNFKDVAARLPTAKQLKALAILDEINDVATRIQKTSGLRTQINYVYWQSLALAEQEERTVTARRKIYEAEQAAKDAEADLSIQRYLEAFEIWAEIFDDYPVLTIDDSAEDLYESIRRYMIAVDSEELADDFPLSAFVKTMESVGSVDKAKQYELFREKQLDLTERRKAELAEEERQREKAAEEAERKAEMSEDADSESGDSEPADSETAKESVGEAADDGGAEPAESADQDSGEAESSEGEAEEGEPKTNETPGEEGEASDPV